MKTYISFSGGVESTTMCLLYGAGATAIFSDTGSEHKEMYERIDYVEKILKAHHNGNFELIRLRAEVTTDGVVVNSLTDYIKERNYFPSARSRFCTRLFKVEVIDKFLRDQGECTLMIGLDADEASDRTGNFGLEANVKYTYPLVDAGLDRQDCKDLLERYGLLPQFPPYMDRGGCKFCPFKSKKEFAAMVHLAPEEMEEIRVLEEGIQDKRNKYFRIRDNMPKLKDFISIEKNNLLGDLSQYYTNDEDRKSCGVFCHR
jgi:3'-phosphoadenosine 5'-phosphosulfate sulfotransferase (PAPS reductase)/FAD synthetase